MREDREAVMPLAGDAPLRLDDPSALFRVAHGEVAVFALVGESDSLPGARRPLFTVAEGGVLGGVAPDIGAFEVVAVALGAARLLRIEATDLERAEALLRWGASIATLAPEAPEAASPAPEAGRIALEPGESIRFEAGCWVMAVSGQAACFGLNEAALTPELGPVPMGEGAWLRAQGAIELLALGPSELAEPAQLEAGRRALAGFAHRAIVRRLATLETADAARIAGRMDAEARAMGRAHRDLAGILEPIGDPAPQGDPLFAALSAIGAASQISFQRPAAGASSPARDPFKAIMRASHVRYRRVRLSGDWWRRDSGPMLAYRLEDRQPIALLPLSPGRYAYLDPATGARLPVDAEVARGLRTHGIVFYRPFADQPLTQKDLLAFAWDVIRSEAHVVLAVAALSAALGVVVPHATYWLLTAVIPSGDRQLLFELGIALFVISAALPALRLVQDYAVLRAETRAEAALNAALWDRVLGMQPQFFRETPAGDLAQRMNTISQLRRALAGTTVQSVISGVFSVTFLAQLFFYSTPMALAGLLVGVLIVAYMGMSAKLTLRERQRVGRPAANTQALVVNYIDGLSKIRVARAEAQAFANVVASYAVNEREDFLVQRYQDRLTLFIEVAPLLAMALFYAGFAAQTSVPGGTSQMGAFIAFSAAFGSFLTGTLGMGNALGNLIDTERKWRKLMRFVNAPLETKRGGLDPGPLAGGIAFKRLAFRYGPKAPYVLRDLSLDIAPGEFVAIVGASGSGKSTLLRLLLGFESAESGKIYLDGNDFAGLDLQAVRRQIGTVLQHDRISRGTLYDNVAVGQGLTYAQVRAACEAAGLDEDLLAMPMGLYTTINEGGSNLSAGQRQRLLIARALARKPSILLFDEATSALDGKTQATISQSLRRLACTRITVAHRLSTIRQADRILVLEGGAIAQEGDFATLSQADGPFRQLMENQLL
ncbi:NHLP bacteriocin export ABC transporter permease/ATPase subunit [bacterium]|nr:NHLP bacteriocin export ABC transporter permease/ATPase subunit [bacterium]